MTTQPTTVTAAQRQARLSLDAIEGLPDVYALACRGHCMEPEIADGSVLVFDKLAVVRSGDVAVIWCRPNLHSAAKSEGAVRRVVMGPPPGVEFPFLRNLGAADAPHVLLRQLNPRRSYPLACTEIVAMHRCVGTTERDRRRLAVRTLEELEG
jgi:hypothetical protein